MYGPYNLHINELIPMKIDSTQRNVPIIITTL